jgi:hypothetical protein
MTRQQRVARTNTSKGVSLILEKAKKRRVYAAERAQVFQQHLLKPAVPHLVCIPQNL